MELSKATLEDAGVYSATATNTHGSVSCRCNLVVDKGIRVYIAPEFYCPLEPADGVFREGEEMRLTAKVEAYPSVGVMWYRNGVSIVGREVKETGRE